MKRYLILGTFFIILSSLFSISYTYTIDQTLLYQIRDTNDPLILAYRATNRDIIPDVVYMDPVPSLENPNSVNTRVSTISTGLANAVNYYFKQLVDPNDLSTQEKAEIKRILLTQLKFCPDNMTSGSTPIPAGSTPGTVVHLIANQENDYRYYTYNFGTTYSTSALSTDEMSEYDRTFSAIHTLAFASMLYDMIYEELSTQERQQITNKIAVVSDYFYNYINNPSLIDGNQTWAWKTSTLPWCFDSTPSSMWTEGNQYMNLYNESMFQAVCALGYSRIVLGKNMNDEALDWCVDFLTTKPIKGDKVGIFSTLLKDSGIFLTGPDYASQTMAGPPQVFFTALNRKLGVNLWNDVNMTKWMKGIVENLDSNYKTYALEYAWLCGYSNTIDRGLLDYFYQNTTDESTRKTIRWYLHRLKGNGTYPLQKDVQINFNGSVIYSYNPNSLSISEDNYIPDFLNTGIQSNSETTIFANPKNSLNQDDSQFKDRLYLHMTHENSFENNLFSANSEKGSFSLYYKGLPFITYDGYRASYVPGSWHQTTAWFNSIYSQNAIVVNPKTEFEADYLNNEFVPDALPADGLYEFSWRLKGAPHSITNYYSYLNPTNYPDECNKAFIFNNNLAKHLKININVEDTDPTTPDIEDVVNINRNFFLFGNDYVLIYDHTSNNASALQLRNSLNFYKDATIVYSNNKFSSRISDSYIYGSMGSNISLSNTRLDGASGDILFQTGLPTGWAFGSHAEKHERLRIETPLSTQTDFITFLIPSIAPNNPIQNAGNTGTSYLIKSTINGNNVYCSLNNSTSIVYTNDKTFNTNSKVMLFDSSPTYTNLKNLLLLNGSYLTGVEVNGTSKNIINVSNLTPDEIISEWKDNQLYITFKQSSSTNPKFKILRSGVEPNNFFFRVNTTNSPLTTWNSPLSNSQIINLCYDDTYFYVNYTYSDLVANNYISTNFKIYKMTITGQTINNEFSTAKGCLVKFSGTNTISTGKEIIIEQGSELQFDTNSLLRVYGTLSTNGTVASPIFIGKYATNTNKWTGIKLESGSRVNLMNTNISQAVTAINSYGILTCNYSSIYNNENGILINGNGGYLVKNNQIFNNSEYGIKISDTFLTSIASEISNNEIYQNRYGFVVYNTNPSCKKNHIYYNEEMGLACIHNASPVIGKTSISNTISNDDYPELYLSDNSYPLISNNGNDILIGDGAYSIYYAPSLSGTSVRDYDARGIWWGTTDRAIIDASLYPSTWSVDASSFATESNTGFTPPDGFESQLMMGLAYESEGQNDLAMQSYQNEVSESSYSSNALVALNRMINVTSNESKSGYSQLQSYYQNISDTTCFNTLKKNLALLDIVCDRKSGNYQTAVSKYETYLASVDNNLDSLYILLDIVNTYIEAQNSESKSMISFKNSNLKLKNIEEAFVASDNLWNRILGDRIKNTGSEIVILPKTLTVNQNYPNPFNPSTNLSFYLPESEKVELTIYNTKGQKVKTLINSSLDKGKHSIVWDGKNSNNKSVSSGVYYYNVKTSKCSISKKMLLIK